MLSQKNIVTIQHAIRATMERVSVAQMATDELQGWIYAAGGMLVSTGCADQKLENIKPHR